MVDNQHQKIKGYRDLSEEEIALINECKELAIKTGQLCEKIDKIPCDQRWLAIAKTDLQKAHMCLVRSIAKPETF